MRRVEIRRSVTESNDAIAARNRGRFAEAGVFVVNLIGSPGCGKTSILEYTAANFGGLFAAIVGDVKTALDAAQIESALEHVPLADIDFLFIENVGNLVCPSAFDLGENVKAAVLSIPEGDEKIRKYPSLFVRADVLFINKVDLADRCPYDIGRVRGDAVKLRGGIRIFETSATQGTGFEDWFDYLRSV
jgi:hydrogenase nickel incorporation protein HypB